MKNQAEEFKSYERQAKRDSIASRVIRSLNPLRSPERKEEVEELKHISYFTHFKIASNDAFMYWFNSLYIKRWCQETILNWKKLQNHIKSL